MSAENLGVYLLSNEIKYNSVIDNVISKSFKFTVKAEKDTKGSLIHRVIALEPV